MGKEVGCPVQLLAANGGGLLKPQEKLLERPEARFLFN